MAKKEQGLSLADIGPAYELVTISEIQNDDGTKTPHQVPIHGIGAKNLLVLSERFPILVQWFRGQKFDLKEFIREAPDAVAAVIAAGLGFAENAEAEEVCGMYGVEVQLDVLEAIGRLTFKSGFGPFVQRILLIAQQVVSVKGSGRAPSTTSLPVSRDSLTVDIREPGTTPPDK